MAKNLYRQPEIGLLQTADPWRDDVRRQAHQAMYGHPRLVQPEPMRRVVASAHTIHKGTISAASVFSEAVEIQESVAKTVLNSQSRVINHFRAAAIWAVAAVLLILVFALRAADGEFAYPYLLAFFFSSFLFAAELISNRANK